MSFSLQDLTWKVVEGDKISDLLLTILDNDGVHHLVSWHKVMTKIFLAHFEANLISFLLFLMKTVDLRQIFGFHQSWSSEYVDISHTIDFRPLVVPSHWLILGECGESSLHILLGVKRSMEIWSLSKWMRNDLA